ncbi:conserved Plasmodium protein, unknown function [Plasmodium knowlesi strain H]|uniref:Uncharacterized protein n=1 Tax=Plasmodium knowlesi (strain H) TaxID=5851 RepID=A0A1A7W314_PLAKH|nr:conserved Plasmodium protein, unknown function [Plasmodium knowlesi strain H]
MGHICPSLIILFFLVYVRFVHVVILFISIYRCCFELM